MPSSYVEAIEPIVGVLIALNPSKVLDVGPGWGKYGLLSREYLHSLETLDAIEVPQGRLFTQDCIYDEIIVADVRDCDNWENYDVIMLIDVIEHVTKEEGLRLLKEMVSVGCTVILSTPREFFHQHVESNPYEEHISHWTPNDFSDFKILYDKSTQRSLIYTIVSRS